MATLPSFRTWVTGEIVTAAELNSNVRDAGNFFLSWPVFEGRQTVAQSLANATPTLLTIDVEDVDTDNGHSTSTNTSRYSFQTTGRFQISGGVGFASNATGLRETYWSLTGVIVNASATEWAPPSGIVGLWPARTRTVFGTAGVDYVELGAQQGSGAALNTAVTAEQQSGMSVRMVGTT